MINEIQTGRNINFTAPGGGVLTSKLYVIGALVVAAMATADATDPFVGVTEGVFEYAVTAADTPAEGALCYFDAGSDEITTVSAGMVFCGWFTTAKDANGNAQFKLAGATA